MKRITSLAELMQAALDRKAVTAGMVFKRTPAAFIINLQGTVIHRLIQSGMFIYEKHNPIPNR